MESRSCSFESHLNNYASTPILNLAIIDHLHLLPVQFEQVIIPQAVHRELKADADLPGSKPILSAIQSGWLGVQTVQEGFNIHPHLWLEFLARAQEG